MSQHCGSFLLEHSAFDPSVLGVSSCIPFLGTEKVLGAMVALKLNVSFVASDAALLFCLLLRV